MVLLIENKKKNKKGINNYMEKTPDPEFSNDEKKQRLNLWLIK
jgi:hypothetical protein